MERLGILGIYGRLCEMPRAEESVGDLVFAAANSKRYFSLPYIGGATSTMASRYADSEGYGRYEVKDAEAGD
jgi:hypothetical protein